MAKLLSIVANPKDEQSSVSKQMLTAFLGKYRTLHPDDPIETLDLYQDNVPYLTGEYIQVVYGGKDPASASKQTNDIIAQAGKFIDRLTKADIIVATIPMWNFNVPAIFKAFIDLVIFPRKTFAFKGPGQFEGLLNGKKLICLGAHGGVYAEGPYKAYDHQDPWLRGIFGFMGITDVQTVWAEGTNLFQGKDLEKAVNDGVSSAAKMAESLTVAVS